MKVKAKKIAFTPTYSKKNKQLLEGSQKESPKTTKQLPIPQHRWAGGEMEGKEDVFMRSISGYIEELRGVDKGKVG